MKYYVGISYSGMHDSNFAIMNGEGQVLFAASEERFSRKKKDGRFPFKSIAYGKRKILKGNKVDFIYVPFADPKVRINEDDVSVDNDLLLIREKRLPLGYGIYGHEWEEKIKKQFPNSKLIYSGHHRSHAAEGYFMSGFKHALLITCDNGCYNEPWIMTVKNAMGCKISDVANFSKNIYYSPAQSYSIVTALLGFKPGMDEGKITGLSAQGRLNMKCIEAIKSVIYSEEASRLISWKYKFNDRVVPLHYVDTDIKNNLCEKLIAYSREDIAYGIQKIVEAEVIKVVNYYKKQTKERNIVLSGGLFANVRLNQKIHELGFKNIFIDPAMSDEGLSLGAILSQSIIKEEKQSTFAGNIYFGPEIEEEIKLIKKNDLKATTFKNETLLIKRIVALLADGKIVAIARGKMEYGPRALGNRSILASPNIQNINAKLNKHLGRNDFMPFAPVTIEEMSDKCFLKLTGRKRASRFMTITSNATAYFQKKCKQIVHVDNTARPQLINKHTNKFYHEIVNQFFEITGIPALINTSFNIHGEPIVCSSSDALKNFLAARLDYLLLGNNLISLENNKHK